MFTSWLEPAGRVAAPILAVQQLEDRSVPAVYYVDPTFTAQAGNVNGTAVNFNAGNASAVNGVIFGQDLAAFNASPGTVNAFADLATAIDVTESANSPGADTILLANAVITLTNPLAGAGVGSEKNVTQTLTIDGAGTGASVVRPTNNTSFSGADDAGTALIRVGTGGNLTATDFRLDGTGFQIGAGVTVAGSANALFQDFAVSGTQFGASTGASIVAQNGATVTLVGADLSNYGRNGLLVISANATVIDSTVTGLGAGNFINNGIEAAGGKVYVSGSTITNNAGRSGAFLSTGISSIDDQLINIGQDGSVTAIGNKISGNAVGLLAGAGAVGDASTLTAQFNNLGNNGFAVDASQALVTIQATNNFFGEASGPFAATFNPTGTGSALLNESKINATQFLTSETPVFGVLGGVQGYFAAIAANGVVINALSPVATTTLLPFVDFGLVFTGVVNPLVRGFNTATGQFVPFDSSFIDVVSTAGTPLTVQLIPGVPGQFTIRVTPAAGQSFKANDTIAATLAAARVIVAAENGERVGFLNSVSNLPTVTFVGATPMAMPITAASTAAPAPASAATVAPTGPAQSPAAAPTESAASATPTPGGPAAVRLFAVGADAGGLPDVQVFSANGTPRERVRAFEDSFTGGVHVATGDVTGDGVDDLVFGAGVGGGPRVRIVDGATGAEVANFFAYDANFRNGVSIAVGDIDGDGVAEVITGAGIGGGPHVKVFSGAGVEILGFFALDSGFRGGVNVAAADLDGDGVAEIVAGAGEGSSEVVVLNGDGVVQSTFSAYEPEFDGGVNVAVVPATDLLAGVIVTGPGAGRAPEVREFDAAGNPVTAFDAFEGGFDGGVRVGTADADADGLVDILAVPGPGGGPRIRGFNLIGDPILDGFAFDGAGTTGLTVG